MIFFFSKVLKIFCLKGAFLLQSNLQLSAYLQFLASFVNLLRTTNIIRLVLGEKVINHGCNISNNASGKGRKSMQLQLQRKLTTSATSWQSTEKNDLKTGNIVNHIWFKVWLTNKSIVYISNMRDKKQNTNRLPQFKALNSNQ